MIASEIKDRIWDRWLHISTSGRDAFKVDERHYAYEPTPYVCLEKLLAQGYVCADNSLLDYGSGKGRVPIFFAAQAGCRTAGVDFDEWMVKKARKNLEQWKSASGRKNAAVDFYHGEAESFTPSGADRFFFFNPFPETVFRTVLGRIVRSCREEGHGGMLFFYYPSESYLGILMSSPDLVFEDEIDCRGFFERSNNRERILIFSVV